mmetsp:Transcript_24198/g.37255  ORF Transcript_24198/g.37255 Transcript_24198/m.37255 type:complete len:91 (+) Transcript_24198:237-509(+)
MTQSLPPSSDRAAQETPSSTSSVFSWWPSRTSDCHEDLIVVNFELEVLQLLAHSESQHFYFIVFHFGVLVNVIKDIIQLLEFYKFLGHLV